MQEQNDDCSGDDYHEGTPPSIREANAKSRIESAPSKSCNAYKTEYDLFLEWCQAESGRSEAHVSVNMLFGYIRYRHEDLGNRGSSLESYCSRIRQYHAALGRNELKEGVESIFNYINKVKKEEPPQKRAQELTSEEVRRFYAEAGHQFIVYKAYLAISLCGFSRISEASSLTRDNVQPCGNDSFCLVFPRMKSNTRTNLILDGPGMPFFSAVAEYMVLLDSPHIDKKKTNGRFFCVMMPNRAPVVQSWFLHGANIQNLTINCTNPPSGIVPPSPSPSLTYSPF